MAKLNFLGTVYLYLDLVSQRKHHFLVYFAIVDLQKEVKLITCKKSISSCNCVLCLFTPRPESLQPEYKQTLGNTSAWSCMQSSKLQRFP